ncbi:MAG: SRPBCC family protein [Pseudonocardiaceae bacterium]
MTEHHFRPPEVATEVAGTPEQVWQLIASGPGISAWFMPATVEPRLGGTISQRHGSGQDDVSHGTISAYEPPHRFTYQEQWEGRTVATEFLVEAQSGGSCVVRIVTHGLSADDADFTSGLVSGWTQALATLRVYLADFAGRPAGSARLWTHSDDTLDDAWSDTIRRAGLDGVTVGQRVERTNGAHPPFTGEVELVQEHGVLVRIDGPHPGVLSFIATDFGGRTSVVVDRYVYADNGAQVAAEAERRAWEAHLTAR